MTAGDYLGMADLADRWRYTRQGIHKLIRCPDFPPPVFAINCDRVKVWARTDIEAYERDRPELGNETAKRRKAIGYYLASIKGPPG